MAELNIKLPPELPESTKRLMAQMRQLNANTTKLQQSMARGNVIQFPTRPAQTQQQQVVTGFRRINQLFHKFETSVQRTIDTALLGFGSQARIFIRQLTFAPDFLSGVTSLLKYVKAPVGAVTTAVGRFLGIGFVYEFGKWIFSKALDFAKAMQNDQRQALSAGTTIGGIRALRVGFDILPGIDELTQTIGMLSSQLTERQFSVIHNILGVKQYADTTRTVVEAILAAQRFMKARQANMALQIARQMHLTEAGFSPQALLMLRNMSTQEAERRARATLQMKGSLELSPDIRENLQRLIITDQWMWEGISNTFGETLYRTGFVATLIQLSNSMDTFVGKFAQSQLADDAAKQLMKGMDALTSSIKPLLPDLQRLTIEVKDTIGQFITVVRTVNNVLNDIQAVLHKIAKGLSFITPAYGGELPRGWRPDTAVEAPPGAARAPGPMFRPGVTRPGLRPEPEISGRRPEPDEPVTPGGTEFRDPVTGKLGGGVIGSGYQTRAQGGHQGQDILTPAGTPIYAAGGGVIERQGTDDWGGQVTVIRLDDGRRIVYMHHHLDPNLKPGTRVEGGQKIGTSGRANNVDHLHFEVWSGPRLHSKNITTQYFPKGRQLRGGQPIDAPVKPQAPTDPGAVQPAPGKPPGGGERYPRMSELKAAAKAQLMKEGLNDEQAEVGSNALIGQAIAESSLKSQMHDQGKIYGRQGGYVPSIYGADRARGQAMVKWLRDNNLDPENPAHQAIWMAHESMQYPGVRRELTQEHPDPGRVADRLTIDYEAPASRMSPATQAERRRNAEYVRANTGKEPAVDTAPPTASQPSSKPPASSSRPINAPRLPLVGEPIRGVVPPAGVRGLPGGPSGPAIERGAEAPTRDTKDVLPLLTQWVAKKENFQSTPFKDYGQINIGYGTAAHGRTSITEPEARQEMQQELAKHLATVDQLNPNLSPGARIAIASLAYNTGGAALDPQKNPNLAAAIKSGDNARIKEWLVKFTHAGGQELPGLMNRRQQEAQIIDDPSYITKGKGTTAAEDFGGNQAPEATVTAAPGNVSRTPRPNVDQVDPYAPGVIRPGLPGGPSGIDPVRLRGAPGTPGTPTAPGVAGLPGGPSGPTVRGKPPTMYIFKGVNGQLDTKAAEAYARSKGFEPKVINSWDTANAVKEAKADIAQNGNRPFGVYGFSLGAKTADTLLADPALKNQASHVTVVGPYQTYPLSNLPDHANVYPDRSSGNIQPKGEGVRLTGKHLEGPGAVAAQADPNYNKSAPSAGGPNADTGPRSDAAVPQEPGIAVKDRNYGGWSPKGYKTAEQAGVRPEFPVADNVNWQLMNAEYIARLNQTYRELPDEDKAKVRMISGYRPTTREEAIKLGMDPHSSQEDIWERSGHGTRFAAAPPGSSRHQLGEASDFDPSEGGNVIMGTEGAKHGVTRIFNRKGQWFDKPHIQLNRSDDSDHLSTEPRQPQQPVPNKEPQAKTDDKPKEDKPADKPKETKGNGDTKGKDKAEVDDHGHTSPPDKHVDLGGSMKGGLKIDNRTDQKVTVEYA